MKKRLLAMAVCLCFTLASFTAMAEPNSVTPEGSALAASVDEGEKLGVELFDTVGEYTFGEPFAAASQANNVYLFDNNPATWWEVGPIGADGFDTYVPSVTLHFKDEKTYVITKIVLSPAADPVWFPSTAAVGTSDDTRTPDLDNYAAKTYTPAASAAQPQDDGKLVIRLSEPVSAAALSVAIKAVPHESGAYGMVRLGDMEIYGYEDVPVIDSAVSPDEYQIVSVWNGQPSGYDIGVNQEHVGTLGDGNPDTWWESGYVGPGPDWYPVYRPYLSLNFKGTYRISKIELTAATGQEASFPSNILVQKSDDTTPPDLTNLTQQPTSYVHKSYTDVGSRYEGVTPADGVYTIAFDEPIVLGALGLEMPLTEAGGSIKLGEMRIYGTKIADPDPSSKLPAGLFDAVGEFTNGELLTAPPQSHCAFLFDGEPGTWWETQPISADGFDTYVPSVTLHFKNEKKYVITKIVLSPAADPVWFPNTAAVGTSDDTRTPDLDNYAAKTYTPAASAAQPQDDGKLVIRLSEPVSAAALSVAIKAVPHESGAYGMVRLGDMEIYGYEDRPEEADDGDAAEDDEGLEELDMSAFNIRTAFRHDLSADENNPSSPASHLFDKSSATEWFPKSPIPVNDTTYGSWKHFLLIESKDGSSYVIEKIRFYGRTGENRNLQFPRSIKVAISDDGEKYTDVFQKDGITMTTSPSYSVTLSGKTATGHLGIEMSDAMMSDGINSLPGLSDMKIFGYKVAEPGPDDGDPEEDDEGLTQLNIEDFNVRVTFRQSLTDNELHADKPLSLLFDDDVKTDWFPKSPVTLNNPLYGHLRHFLVLEGKDGRQFVIQKIRIYGQQDIREDGTHGDRFNVQFPRNIKVASSDNGKDYADLFVKDDIVMTTSPSYSITLEGKNAANYWGIELGNAIMNDGINCLPILSQIKLFGYEYTYTPAENNLNDPDGETNTDRDFPTLLDGHTYYDPEEFFNKQF